MAREREPGYNTYFYLMGFKNGEVNLNHRRALMTEIALLYHEKDFIYDNVIDTKWGIITLVPEKALHKKILNFIEPFKDFYNNPGRFHNTWKDFIQYCFVQRRLNEDFSECIQEHLFGLHNSTNGEEFQRILNSLLSKVLDYAVENTTPETEDFIVPQKIYMKPQLETWALIFDAKEDQWIFPTKCIEYNGSKIYVQFIAGKIAQLQVIFFPKAIFQSIKSTMCGWNICLYLSNTSINMAVSSLQITIIYFLVLN